MVMYYLIFSIIFGTVSLQRYADHTLDHEYVANEISHFNSQYSRMWYLRQVAEWQYITNINSDTTAAREKADEIFTAFLHTWREWAYKFKGGKFPPLITNTLNTLTLGILSNERDSRALSRLKSKTTNIYSTPVSFSKLNIKAQGETECGSLMGKFRDPALLLHLWKSWRIQVGEKMRPFFLKMIKLSNKAARENGYDNIGSNWKKEFGSSNVLDTAFALWEEIKPLYAQLHAYVLHKLRQTYGERYFSTRGFIPAHLLGSLWGENWEALYDILVPYPDQPFFSLTEVFQSKNYSVYDLIRKVEEFYVRSGMDPMEQSTWQKSMFVKPEDGRIVDCHASAYDFSLDNDYRIKMCGSVDKETFFRALHEMGHIEYYMAYNHLPMVYRYGANSGFHEAVGETMVYAVQNPQCLQLLNLMKSSENSREMFINNLMKQALSKIVLLPWALTIETWRFSFQSGEISEEEMDEKWWELRQSLQGIDPPDEESRKLFDAGTKYHIVNNIPYMRYFIGRILEHMFLEALCGIIKEDVHNCCLMNDKNAGKRLMEILKMGSTVPWQVALEVLTGEREMSARPLIKYYEPLYLWLVDYNGRHNITTVL